MSTTKISIVTPAFNEEKNLPILYERVIKALDKLGVGWEWIVVDDHSGDRTFEITQEIAKKDSRVRSIRLSRNFGSHMAITCGFHHATGDGAIVIAADLQDPPEILSELLKIWRKGAQVVWAKRDQRQGEARAKIGFSNLYYMMMRRFVGLTEMPEKGADFFLIDRVVLDTLKRFKEKNVSLFALIAWLGFKQEFIIYNKEARVHGKSGWSLEKKIKLAIDSVVSFTYRPIRFISYIGFFVAIVGFTYAGLILFRVFSGTRPEGWASLMVVILIIGGMQMLMMGVLGEYIWRVLDEARGRPYYVIEAIAGQDKQVSERG